MLLLSVYPQLMDTLIDRFFRPFEWVTGRLDDLTCEGLERQIEYEEEMLARLAEQLAALEWLRVALMTLPIEYPKREWR